MSRRRSSSPSRRSRRGQSPAGWRLPRSRVRRLARGRRASAPGGCRRLRRRAGRRQRRARRRCTACSARTKLLPTPASPRAWRARWSAAASPPASAIATSGAVELTGDLPGLRRAQRHRLRCARRSCPASSRSRRAASPPAPAAPAARSASPSAKAAPKSTAALPARASPRAPGPVALNCVLPLGLRGGRRRQPRRLRLG
jgi:hypothetical protein